MAAEFQVKGQWRTESYGHVYTAKAVTPSGRILGVVNIEVPLDILVRIRDRFGDNWVDEVERSASAQVAQVAQGWDQSLRETKA